MQTNLSDYRKSYEKGELLEGNLPQNPLELFSRWFDEVEKEGGVEETNAMTVSSIGIDGFPKNRVVLLKSFSDKGFVFYTNYNSEKSKAILINPKVGLSFFWPNLERQIIVKGIATKLSESASTDYFNKRPRGSQIGAWASNQSEPLNSRRVLVDRMSELKVEFEGKDIEKPSHWGGFNVEPHSIEFWQGRANRLHDRMLYSFKLGTWSHIRLAP